MTARQDILIRLGAAVDTLLVAPGLTTTGRRLRGHIRDRIGNPATRFQLSDTGGGLAFVAGGIRLRIGAVETAAQSIGEKKSAEWEYSVESWVEGDLDDVIVTHAGTAHVFANATRPTDVTPVPGQPSGDGRYVRFDGPQDLTPEEQAQVRENAGIVGGGGDAAWGGITGSLPDQADLQAALDGKETAGAAATAVSNHVAASDPHGDRAYTDAQLASYQLTSAKGQPNGYAALDAGGKLPQGQLPSIAITEYLGTAANEASMLALIGELGDWCTRTDLGTVWIITGADPSVIGGWTQLSYPADAVSSVAGRTGAVLLSTADISGLGTAATAAATDFATAAQGALADTAVQPAAIATKLDDLSPGTADALVTASADGTLLSRAAHTIASLLAAARDRATHTGSQVAATISDFAAAALAAVTWSSLDGKPATFTPSAHQSAHAVGGGDPLAGLASVQMPTVSAGTAISTTTHTASDADAGQLISCTHASGCEVTFTDSGGDALTPGTSGGYLRGTGAGPISWAAAGTMVITTISTSAGHTETAAAPSRLFWHCVSASLVHVWGETA